MSTQTDQSGSFTVNAAMSAFGRVTLSSNGSIGLAASTETGIGVLQRDVTADSFVVAPVRYFGTGSYKARVTAQPGTAGGYAYAAASGRVAPTGTITVGVFRDSFAVNDTVVEVLSLN